MKTTSKKEIELSVNNSLLTVVSEFNIAEPSKKTNKLIKKISKRISTELKNDLKKQVKQMAKASKRSSNGKVVSKTPSA